MTTKELLRRFLIPSSERHRPAIVPGLYHYQREASVESYDPGAYTRFHLRVEPDGRGILLANATAAARLSPSGVLIAKGLLDDEDEKQIIERLRGHFRGSTTEQMYTDLERVAALIANLVAPGDNYPIINLGDPALSPYEAQLMAPLQADLPLAEPEKLVPIIDRLWQAAIPHVTILAPEAPQADHLVRAVERAEDLGMIAGVRGRATDLEPGRLLADLAMAGVDHVTVPFASADPAVHDALYSDGDHQASNALFATILRHEVAAVAEVPLIARTVPSLGEALEALVEAGVTNINFFAIAAPDEMPEDERAGSLLASAMPQTADLIEELADQMEVRFVWQPPMLADPTRGLIAQVRQGPRCSDDLSVRVEPNGNVIPPRGPYRSAGNLLTDDWASIWNNQAFIKYRERVEKPTRCDDCPGLAICAADCPRKIAGWSLRSEVRTDGE